MEKIKITAEQEKALKEWKNEGLTLEDFINTVLKDGEKVDLESLNRISIKDFSYMLNGWYEVIDDIQVGDWVKYAEGQIRFREKLSFNEKTEIIKEIPKYYKIVEKYSEGAQSFCELSLQFAKVNSHLFEKVEPWKIMLLELGREKPEFKIGDKYTLVKGSECTVLSKNGIKALKDCFKTGKVTYFYPVESRIEVKNQ